MEMTVGEALIITVIIPIVIGLVVGILVALIPATIAKNKGYRAGLWWLYGFFLFWIALIHALCLKDLTVKPQVRVVRAAAPTRPVAPAPTASDINVKKLKQYKELLDNGVITQEEFEQKKKELLDF